MTRKRVGLVVFDNVEVLDFCGPFEVFSATRIDENKRQDTLSPFETVLIAEKVQPIIATGNMKVIPDYSFDTCPKIDILIVPGGFGTRKESKNPVMLEWLKVKNDEVELVASVCTGSLLLGYCGLLNRLSATTHWLLLDWMHNNFPNVNVVRDEHVIEQGRIITSAGISAGIDMALIVVARYYGIEIAKNTAKYMEYPYPENNKRRIAI